MAGGDLAAEAPNALDGSLQQKGPGTGTHMKRARDEQIEDTNIPSDDLPNASLRAHIRSEGTGDQSRMVPQPKAAPVEEPQQTQEACCLEDDDENTRDDDPISEAEMTVKPVNGELIDAPNMESVSPRVQHVAKPQASLKRSSKRKATPENSQGMDFSSSVLLSLALTTRQLTEGALCFCRQLWGHCDQWRQPSRRRRSCRQAPEGPGGPAQYCST